MQNRIQGEEINVKIEEKKRKTEAAIVKLKEDIKDKIEVIKVSNYI